MNYFHYDVVLTANLDVLYFSAKNGPAGQVLKVNH